MLGGRLVTSPTQGLGTIPAFVLESGYISFKTHRQDLNEYLYVPRSSCHPPGFFSGIILGANCRLDRTNRSASSRLDAVRLFEHKLSARVYNKSFIRAVVARREKKSPKKFSFVPFVVPEEGFPQSGA